MLPYEKSDSVNRQDRNRQTIESPIALAASQWFESSGSFSRFDVLLLLTANKRPLPVVQRGTSMRQAILPIGSYETNWTPATVPDGPDDTATFDVSNTTNVYPLFSLTMRKSTASCLTLALARSRSLSISYNSSYEVTILTISGVGITNNSGIIQNFVTL